MKDGGPGWYVANVGWVPILNYPIHSIISSFPSWLPPSFFCLLSPSHLPIKSPIKSPIYPIQWSQVKSSLSFEYLYLYLLLDTSMTDQHSILFIPVIAVVSILSILSVVCVILTLHLLQHAKPKLPCKTNTIRPWTQLFSHFISKT